MGDPLDDFNRRDYAQYVSELSRPVCGICGEHIMDDRCYHIHGDYYHQDCVWESEEDTESWRDA